MEKIHTYITQIGVVLGTLAVVVSLGLALPTPAQATWSDYDLGTTYGGNSGYGNSSAGTIWGTSSCCTPTYSTPSYNYPTYRAPTYNYPTYSYPSYTSSAPLFTYNNNNNSNTNTNTNTINLGSTYTPPTYTPPVQNRPVCALSASDTSVEEGDSTTLHWTSENAYSASLSGVGTVSTGGSQSVHPTSSRTYTLTVVGSYGSDTCTVHVNVDEDEDEDDEDAPTCDLSVSPSRIDDNDSATLRWETDGDVDSASINEGIGSVDEDGGSERVSPNEDTTYRMTVRGPGGSDTCTATLRVDEEENAFSSTVFTDEAPQNPPVVYLSSIPYTGVDDISPALMAYWLLLIAGAGGVAWFMFAKGLFGRFTPAYAMSSVAYASEPAETEEETTSNVDAFVSALAGNAEDAALEYLRTAAVDGTGVEEFLTDARATVADEILATRIDAMIAGAQITGIRGAKAALAA